MRYRLTLRNYPAEKKKLNKDSNQYHVHEKATIGLYPEPVESILLLFSHLCLGLLQGILTKILE
jgi:hypothetical protein